MNLTSSLGSVLTLRRARKEICRSVEIFSRKIFQINCSEKADVMYVSNALLPDYEDNFDGVAEVLSKVLSLNSQHQQSEKVLHMLREIKAKKDAGNEFFKEEKYCTVLVLYGEALQLDEFHLKVIEKVHFSRTMAIQS